MAPNLTLISITPVNCLVPPGLCPGYGPCGGGLYLGDDPANQAQPKASTAVLIAGAGNRQTVAGAVHVPQNILFVGDVPMATDALDDDKLYREYKTTAPPSVQKKQVIINIAQPLTAGALIPVNLRLVVNGDTQTVYIDSRV